MSSISLKKVKHAQSNSLINGGKKNNNQHLDEQKKTISNSSAQENISPYISPLEYAILNNKEIIFYLYSDDEEYKESAQLMLQWCYEELQETYDSLKMPEYKFEIGDAPSCDGTLVDENQKIIISHVGGAGCG